MRETNAAGKNGSSGRASGMAATIDWLFDSGRMTGSERQADGKCPESAGEKKTVQAGKGNFGAEKTRRAGECFVKETASEIP